MHGETAAYCSLLSSLPPLSATSSLTACARVLSDLVYLLAVAAAATAVRVTSCAVASFGRQIINQSATTTGEESSAGRPAGRPAHHGLAARPAAAAVCTREITARRRPRSGPAGSRRRLFAVVVLSDTDNACLRCLVNVRPSVRPSAAAAGSRAVRSNALPPTCPRGRLRGKIG